MDSGLFLAAVEFTDNQTPPVVPAAPTSLIITNSAGLIDLSWSTGDTYSLQVVDRAVGTGDFDALATIGGSDTTYEDTTVTGGISYSYRVRGLKSGIPSPYSNTATATVTAAVFAAISAENALNYLDGGNPAALAVGTSDTFILGGWVSWQGPLTSEDQVFISNGDFYTTGTGVYGLDISGSTPVGAVTLNVGGGTQVLSTSNLATNTKTFILAWYDGSSINIQINNGTIGTLAGAVDFSTAISGPFTMFADGNVAVRTPANITMDEWFFCKNPGTFATALTAAKALYNSGTGTLYSAVSSGTKTTLGLISWWGLDEASAATRKDLNSTNDLTLHGTITQTTPLVS